ncbi:MAG: TatD family hydrolase [Bacteroidetes bacterium]|nr:TatD family hydrolase [Bacteroidota bacterium]
MNLIPYIDIHTHPFRNETDTVIVQNIFPGEGFAAFTGRNFYSVGLHPWHIKSHEKDNELLVMVEDALEFDHVIFIGECGLDKKAETNFEEQKRVFEAQAFMAEEFRKPLIIHCVKAFNEVLELHKKLHPEMPWIMHGYNGNIQITKQLEKQGVLFSFGQNLFKSDAKVIESFQYLNSDKIFFETDEVDDEVEKMYIKGAQLKNIPVELLKKTIWDNFKRIENISTNLF